MARIHVSGCDGRKSNPEAERRIGEYADGEFIEELADVFIVAASLSERWGNMTGTFTMKAVVRHAERDNDALYQSICRKMEINAARVWKKLPDGRYKHEQEFVAI